MPARSLRKRALTLPKTNVLTTWLQAASIAQPMATLHVRNVPDALYDVLREEAETNGRSIGAEAIHVLTRGLFGRRRRLPRGVRPQAGQSAFDADARAAVAAAQDVA